MEKVIFLDLDGVLNSFDNMRAMTCLSKNFTDEKSMDHYGHLFDYRCVCWLSYIISSTNANIVISSSWRNVGLDKILELWSYRDLPGKVIGCTPTIADPDIVNLYASSNNEADRGYEIAQWLHENKVDNYCIIDDDSDILPHQIPFFVKTESDFGLTYKSAKKAIEILNHISL